MKKQECPFKVKCYKYYVDTFGWVTIFHKPNCSDYKTYDGCDMRDYKECVGEGRCPIMKK